MHSHKDLIVWQKGIDLVAEIYLLTKLFPNEEKFGLISQIRRAATSIPANIAEGYARRGRKENHQFINIAFGSAVELETHLIISKRINYTTSVQCAKIDALLQEVTKMLYRYRSSLASNCSL